MNSHMHVYAIVIAALLALSGCGSSQFTGEGVSIHASRGQNLKASSSSDGGDGSDSGDAGGAEADGGYDGDDGSGSGNLGGSDSSADDCDGKDCLGGDGDELASDSLATRNLCSDAGEKSAGSSVKSSSGVLLKLVHAGSGDDHEQEVEGDGAAIRQRLLDKQSVRIPGGLDDGDYHVLLCDAAQVADCKLTTAPSAGGDIKRYFLKNGRDMKALGVSDGTVRIKDGEIDGPKPLLWTMYDNRQKSSSADACDENSSPLVIDLVGTGISLSPPVVHFDIKGDGSMPKISWFTHSEQKLLALDINNNGVIDDGRELFGDSTLMPDGTKAVNGFDALAQYDADASGAIDAQDPVFNLLRLWSDRNGDGKTAAAELTTLSSDAVASIFVTYLTHEERDGFGNIQRERSSARLTNGRQVPVVDVWFKLPTAVASWR